MLASAWAALWDAASGLGRQGPGRGRADQGLPSFRIGDKNPPRPLASKRVDLISNKLIKIKEKKPPLYPLQGPRGGV